MNKVLFIIFSFLFLSCNSEQGIQNIEYEFYPAFFSPITYSIDLSNGRLYQNSKLYSVNGTIQGSENLINKEYEISNENLTTFLNEINKIGLDSSIVHQRDVLDGIGFKFMTIDQKNDTISLISVSPDRKEENKVDYLVLDPFFRLANETINNYKGICITEIIQDYFDYDLPIKQINDEPLEYRVWGTISGCESDNPELIEFLDSLPNNKPVIFDLRNGSFAPCLSNLLDRYGVNKHLYYYGNNLLTRTDLQLETLKDQLKVVEKHNNSMAEPLTVSIREAEKFKEEIENRLIQNRNTYRTKQEILKTIANKGYKSTPGF